MAATERTDTRTPFRASEDDPVAEWWCPIAADVDVEDPWAGWTTVTGNARRGVVDHDGTTYTPAEARQVAEALRAAADHVESYSRRTAAFLFGMTMGGHFPEIDGLPTELQCAIRDALRRAGDRFREESWAGRSREDGAAAGTPNQAGGAR
jgi:hypothetical protein